MGREIERKFLVTSDAWRAGAPGTPIRQGYLSLDPERTVRVRLAGEKAFLTVKGLTRGATRDEFEYPIPAADAAAMLDGLCLAVIEKTRHRVDFGGTLWDVDVFAGASAGLVLAEIELESEGSTIRRPGWLGQEVTDDPRYYNSNLATNPWSRWGKA
jgi:adenylate cyclase